MTMQSAFSSWNWALLAAHFSKHYLKDCQPWLGAHRFVLGDFLKRDSFPGEDLVVSNVQERLKTRQTLASLSDDYAYDVFLEIDRENYAHDFILPVLASFGEWSYCTIQLVPRADVSSPYGAGKTDYSLQVLPKNGMQFGYFQRGSNTLQAHTPRTSCEPLTLRTLNTNVQISSRVVCKRSSLSTPPIAERVEIPQCFR